MSFGIKPTIRTIIQTLWVRNLLTTIHAFEAVAHLTLFTLSIAPNYLMIFNVT
jgi:hypothetical protein